MLNYHKNATLKIIENGMSRRKLKRYEIKLWVINPLKMNMSI